MEGGKTDADGASFLQRKLSRERRHLCILFLKLGSSISIWLGNLQSGRSRGSQLLPGGNSLLTVLASDESSMSLDADEERKNSRCNDTGSHEDEGLVVIELTEAKTEGDGSSVSSSTNNSCDGSSGRGVDVGDNTV